MSGKKSKSPPQRRRSRSRRRVPGRSDALLELEDGGCMGMKVDVGGRVMASKSSETNLPADYSVNALSKKLGRDRRTIDKAVAGITPTRVAGKTKFYRLEDVEAAFKEKSNSKLRDHKVFQEIRKLRIANDQAEGLVVPKTKVAESIRKCLPQIATLLEQRLVNEYPTAVAGLDVPQARIYGKRLSDEILKSFQELEREWVF